jgi:hypothetical protein
LKFVGPYSVTLGYAADLFSFDFDRSLDFDPDSSPVFGEKLTARCWVRILAPSPRMAPWSDGEATFFRSRLTIDLILY